MCRKREMRPGILSRILRREGRQGGSRRASVVITVKPMISQWKKGRGKEIYLCSKHYRMLLRAFDEVVDRDVKGKSS